MNHSDVGRLTDELLDAMLGKTPRERVGEIASSPEATAAMPAETLTRFRAVSSTLDRARQRHDLLQALLTVTHELTSVRDRGQTMSLLVRLTRSLLRADMAYLSFNDDESGSTYIRETDGVLTEAYRSIRMRFGAGVLGRVAAANGPYQTSEYLSDPEVMSDPDTRRRVAEEGVQSIVGAPIRLGGRIIGALLVADRTQREYDSGEVAALDSLAAHAAAVLDNLRVFEELESDLAAAEAERAERETQIAELARVDEAGRRLLSGLVEPGAPEQWAATLSEVIGAPAVAVEAPALRTLLPRGARPAAVWGLERRLIDAVESGECVEIAHGAGSQTTYYLVPVMRGARLLGAVGMSVQPSRVERLILLRAAFAFGALLSFQQAIEVSGAREQSELVDALLAGRPDVEHAGLARRAKRFGLDLDAPAVALVVEPVVASSRQIAKLVAELASGRGVTIERDGRVHALVNAADAESLAIEWAQRCASRGMNATVAAEQAAGLTAIPHAHQNAEAVLAAALRLGRRGEPCTQTMLGVAALLIGGDTTGVTDRIVRYTIGPLIDYDEQRGTDLAGTALGYLDSNQKVSRCAELLHLHENTVRQRLARLDELLGEEWRQGTKCLDTHLALRLHQLARA